MVMRCLPISRALAASRSAHAAGRRVNAASQQLRVIAPTEAATQRLAELLAEHARPGDCICLYGQVGAGKSFFRCSLQHSGCLCRFVRALGKDPAHPASVLPMSTAGRCCSRAFIRWALGEPGMAVPSPTYLLQNIYDDLEGNAYPVRSLLTPRAAVHI